MISYQITTRSSEQRQEVGSDIVPSFCSDDAEVSRRLNTRIIDAASQPPIQQSYIMDGLDPSFDVTIWP